MTTIIRDDGFQIDDLAQTEFATPATLAQTPGSHLALDLPNDADPAALVPFFARLAVIRIPFPAFSDGRGFSLARRLRQLGYTGRLRASGHLIADQYVNARRSGFDEIAISQDLAARQPQPHWQARSDWDRPSYQDRLRKAG